MVLTTKVIIVSPAEIHEYFTNAYADEWDTQIPVETIQDMWDGLQTGKLSADTGLVIFSDAYMTDYSDDLATAIAAFAPDALVLVLFYDIDQYAKLTGLVNAKIKEFNTAPGKFYPVNTLGDIGQEIYDAFVKYDEDLRKPSPEVGLEQAVAAEQASPSLDESDSISQVRQENRQRGLILASTSSKGGSGKTTVALCTASMIYHSSRIAAEQGLREKPLSVCVVDMDTRDGQIGFLLGQSSPTALNIFIKDNSEETIRENLIADERLGVYALLAPKRARTADYLTPEFYQDVIQKLSYMFDVVLLDTSVNYLDPLIGSVVLPISDAIMFVTNLSLGSVYGMNRWMDEVTSPIESGGSGIDRGKIGVVVNQSAPDLGIDQELLSNAAAGAQLLVAVPLDTAAVVAASNHHRLSDIILYHKDISPAYYSLVKQILGNQALVAPLDVANAVATKRPSSTPQTDNKKKKGLFK